MIGPNDRTFFSKDGNFHLAQGTIFESRKRGCSPNKLTPLNIALPFSFIDFYKRHKGKDVSRKFQNMNDNER